MTLRHVLIEGRLAGELTRLPGGRLSFRYEDGYTGTPLSVSMPRLDPVHTDGSIRPWLEGLLPDNEAVIGRWSREFQVGPSAFALLGTRIGEDCAGAVQIVRPERLEAVRDGAGSIRWLREDELAGHLRELRRDQTAWLGSIAAGGFSLAGAHAKTALFHDGERWGVPEGSAPTSHILKPAIPGFDGHEVNEHVCLEAAHLCGIRAARSTVLRVADQTVISITRYDRAWVDGRFIRIHQEDLCQALSVPPSRKYEADGGPGGRAILRVLRTAMPASVAHRSAGRFLDSLAFNWFIAGTDAHAKNHGLLLSGDRVQFAPVYDIASALPYPGFHERRLKMAMKLGRDYGVWPHHDPWPGSARAWGVDADELRERVLAMGARIPDAFRDVAASREVRSLESPMPAMLTDLVADRVRRCLAVMG